MDEKTIKNFVEKQIKDKDIFLVEVSLKPGNVVHITVDKPEGISIDECVSLSRDFNSAFDRDEEDYDLQVSSPGLDSPLKVEQQFEKYRNKDVRVILDDGEKLKAVLLDFNENELKLMISRTVKEEGKKKKKRVNEEKIINKDKIKAVKAVISFK